jgi:hypothetical protein
LNPFGFQPDLLEQRFCLVYSSLCVVITFQVMAVSRQSAGNHYPIEAILESL